MRKRIKPFVYDAVETPSCVLFVFPFQGADGRPAKHMIAHNGLQVTRPDGTILRIGNLHPRLREALSQKPIFMVESDGERVALYPVGSSIPPSETLSDYFSDRFYWFIGPETSTIREVAERPLSRLLSGTLHRVIVVAPGEAINGPLIGMCLSRGGIVALARGRSWAQARPGLIIDAGLAAGTTTGYPANDNIQECVDFAHSETASPPDARARRSWRSQIAVAFPPIDPQISDAHSSSLGASAPQP